MRRFVSTSVLAVSAVPRLQMPVLSSQPAEAQSSTESGKAGKQQQQTGRLRRHVYVEARRADRELLDAVLTTCDIEVSRVEARQRIGGYVDVEQQTRRGFIRL